MRSSDGVSNGTPNGILNGVIIENTEGSVDDGVIEGHGEGDGDTDDRSSHPRPPIIAVNGNIIKSPLTCPHTLRPDTPPTRPICPTETH